MASRPHFFTTEPNVRYESFREKIGGIILAAHMYAGYAGLQIRRVLPGVK